MVNQFIYCDFKEEYRKPLIDLYKEIWKEPPWNEFFWTDKMVDDDISFALDQKDFIGKLALCSNDVVGFTWGYKLPFEKFPFLKGVTRDETIYIDELAVRSDFRRRKIGATLTNLLIENAIGLGYYDLILRTDVNGVAYAFYKSLGFDDTEVRDPTYPERTYMKKSIR
jgi:ribosomal protein S18 acetylase RimI-like enzyme